MNYKNSLLTLTVAAITTSCAPMYTQPKIIVIDKHANLEEITINNYYLNPGSQFMIRGSIYYFDRFDSRSSMYFFYSSGAAGQRTYFYWNLNTLNWWARQGHFYPYAPQNTPRLFHKYNMPQHNEQQRPFNRYNQPHKSRQNSSNSNSNSRRAKTNNKTTRNKAKK